MRRGTYGGRGRAPARAAAIVEFDDDMFSEEMVNTPSQPKRAVSSVRATPPRSTARVAREDDVCDYDDDQFDEDVGGKYVDKRRANIESARATMHPPSEEQSLALKSVSDHNVVIDAVAGSGKTTFILYMAITYALRMLLLTYNAKLKFETRSRADALGITNLEVHTYHSFCVKYISGDCFRDSAIAQNIYNEDGTLVQYDTPDYDLVIIDEAQDMSPLYYDVGRIAMKRAQSDGVPPVKIVVLGDRNQSIYGFMGADTRFITMAEQIYGGKWKRHALTTSYRVTRQIAAFVNVLTSIGNRDAPVMRAVKDGPKPVYMWCTKTEIADAIARRARECPGDVFVLASSVKQRPNHPYAPIVNALVKLGIFVYVPTNDDAVADPNVTQGKVVFSTFHQAKGLERKHVFVLGFDATQTRDNESYIKCSNEMYVACTRSLETLTVWHDKSKIGNRDPIGPLPYLPYDLLGDTCTYAPGRPPHDILPMDALMTHTYYESVTELLRHMPDVYLTEALAGVEVVSISEPGTFIDIPPVSQQKITIKDVEKIIYEDVSAITGTAVAASHELAKKGESTIYKIVKAKRDPAIANITLNPAVPGPLLRLTVIYESHNTQLKNTRNQIRKYDWITKEQMRVCNARLSALIPEDTGTYEEAVIMPGFDPRTVKSVRAIAGGTRPLNVHGRSDIVVDDRLYEIKAVGSLSDTHVAQLLMYYYGYLCAGKRYAMYLYNVLTDELCKVEVNDENLVHSMQVLNHAKNHVDESADDDAFLAKCNDGKYQGVSAKIANCTKCAYALVRMTEALEAGRAAHNP